MCVCVVVCIRRCVCAWLCVCVVVCMRSCVCAWMRVIKRTSILKTNDRLLGRKHFIRAFHIDAWLCYVKLFLIAFGDVGSQRFDLTNILHKV